MRNIEKRDPISKTQEEKIVLFQDEARGEDTKSKKDGLRIRIEKIKKKLKKTPEGSATALILEEELARIERRRRKIYMRLYRRRPEAKKNYSDYYKKNKEFIKERRRLARLLKTQDGKETKQESAKSEAEVIEHRRKIRREYTEKIWALMHTSDTNMRKNLVFIITEIFDRFGKEEVKKSKLPVLLKEICGIAFRRKTIDKKISRLKEEFGENSPLLYAGGRVILNKNSPYWEKFLLKGKKIFEKKTEKEKSPEK